jgi:hypothetical protein
MGKIFLDGSLATNRALHCIRSFATGVIASVRVSASTAIRLAAEYHGLCRKILGLSLPPQIQHSVARNCVYQAA